MCFIEVVPPILSHEIDMKSGYLRIDSLRNTPMWCLPYILFSNSCGPGEVRGEDKTGRKDIKEMVTRPIFALMKDVMHGDIIAEAILI